VITHVCFVAFVAASFGTDPPATARWYWPHHLRPFAMFRNTLNGTLRIRFTWM